MGIFILITVMAVGLGCSKMKGFIFDKWCWSAGTESCTLQVHFMNNMKIPSKVS